MTTPSSARTFNRGDWVRHPKRPEWGLGTVRAARGILHHGTRAQRLEVDFANKGRVTLNTAVAALTPCDRPRQMTLPYSNGGGGNRPPNTSAAPDLDAAQNQGEPVSMSSSLSSSSTGLSGGGWLASIGGNNNQSHELWDLPSALTDPFASRAQRLKATLETYRFSTEPRSLIEWATMQTGLDDPLSKYTRPELEQAFPRFARDRDQHLRNLVRDMKRNGEREDLRLIANKTQLPAARSSLDKAIRN